MKKFKTPRVYIVEFIEAGKFFSKMLGIAYNARQRQKFYDQFRVIEYWNKTAKLRSEGL